jgi:NADH-quinone oxidoreductase subunit L
MKITWITFGLAWLAIIGLPPLSGFFSKEPIIAAAFDRPGWTGWLFGSAALIGAGVTAFYMTRLFVLTFHGPKRWTHDIARPDSPPGDLARPEAPPGGIEHPHESPPVMTIPLILLAVGSAASGYLMSTSVVTWLTPVFGDQTEPHGPLSHTTVTVLSIAITVLGAGIGWLLFRGGTALQPQPAGPLVVAARKNLYGDAVNETVFEKPGKYLTRALVYFDNKGIDGLVNGLAAAVGGGSGRLRRAQTGFVRSYALSMLGGAVLVAVAFLLVRLG